MSKTSASTKIQWRWREFHSWCSQHWKSALNIQKHLFPERVSPGTGVNTKTLLLTVFIRLSRVSGPLSLQREVAVEFLNWHFKHESWCHFTFPNNKNIEVKYKPCVLLYCPVSNGALCSRAETGFCWACGHMSQSIKSNLERTCYPCWKHNMHKFAYCNATKWLCTCFWDKSSKL